MDEARTNLDVDWMARVLAADLNTPARPGAFRRRLLRPMDQEIARSFTEAQLQELERVLAPSVEVVIEQALEYAHACGWDHLVQDELAAQAVQLVRPEWSERRCQSKIPNTWSGHRTAQIDPEKCRKINGREIRF